jgi:hypothetical protein
MARGSLPHQRVCSQWWMILGPRRAVALRTEPTHHPAAQASPAHRQPLRAYGPSHPRVSAGGAHVRAPPPGSCLGAVAQVPHAVAEPTRIQQLQLKPDPAGRVLIHQPGRDGLGAEGGTTHGAVTPGCGFQLPDRFGSKSCSIRLRVVEAAGRCRPAAPGGC